MAKEKQKNQVDDMPPAPMGDDITENEVSETGITNVEEPPRETPKEFTPEIQGQLEHYFLNNPNIAAYVEKQIADGIKKALQGTPPKANTADPTEQEKKSFDKMTYKERLNLFKSNPQAYYKLSKGV
jgi:hypothetical protein